MRLILLILWVRLVRFFNPYECEKESFGYSCLHNMHGNKAECGRWSKVRGYDHAEN